jgi:hypothetical protein
MNNGSENAKKVWNHAIDFTSKDKSFAVRITACLLDPKFEGAVPLTHYTWELVRLYDNKVARHFPFGCSVNDGTARVEAFNIDELSELIVEAHEWVRQKRQEREDMITQRRLDKTNTKRR